MLRIQEAKCLHPWPSQDPRPPHSLLYCCQSRWSYWQCPGLKQIWMLEKSAKRIFWRHLKVFLHLLQLSMVLWAGLMVVQSKNDQSQVSPRWYLFREHLRGRRAQGRGFSRFDTYCSLKWAAQPNAGHSLPTPAWSAAVLALVKGLPKHLPSIKS